MLEQPNEHLAFSSVVGHQVPQVADLGLTDPVDATEALFDPVRVPREVVIDHEVGTLEVQPFPGGVGGDEDADVGVLGEALLGGAALLASDTPVNGDHRLIFTEEVFGCGRAGS